MRMTARIYGKTVQTWKHEDERGREVIAQREIEYREYDLEDGSLIGTGTEDFSEQRYRDQFIEKLVWVWDGEKRNKGGHRWFEYVGTVAYARGKAANIKKYLKIKYNDAEVIQLR